MSLMAEAKCCAAYTQATMKIPSKTGAVTLLPHKQPLQIILSPNIPKKKCEWMRAQIQIPDFKLVFRAKKYFLRLKHLPNILGVLMDHFEVESPQNSSL